MYKFFITLFFLLFSNSVVANDLVKPTPNIPPMQVVEVQLFALQSNNPENDFGIKQTWEFAHPRNKMVTGPIDRFANMMRTPAYNLLLNNKEFETQEIFNNGNNAGIAVRIEATDNKAYGYMWSLEKVKESGPLFGSWMTTGVSGPKLLAEGS